ncbi:MAG: 6-carboxytetrahydropterin synthase [Bacteroidales bacterium]|nr:6-carboxytetrahydropterin synthase [Bacteroidales bacterium]
MAKIRLTKEFEFEMAHLLDGYDGLCRNIHGHSYKLFVTVKGEPEKDPKSPKMGMVLDFSVLKKIVKEEIVDRLDHAMLVMRGTEQATMLKGIADRIYEVDYQPTCENMVTEFANRIRARLPKNVELHCVKLHETSTSYAEWYAEDNN